MSTSSDTSAVLTALRDATRAQHDQLDGLSPLTNSSMTRDDYLAHAARVLGWMRPLEQNLWASPGAVTLPVELQPESRNVKTSWLECDLAEGGLSQADIEALPVCPYTPEPNTLAEMMGVAYVSEGATLGGAFLYKRLAPRMGGLSLRWLKGYGSDTGSMWQCFLRHLGQQVESPEDILQAQRAAQQAFDSFRRWVIDEAMTSTR